MSGIHITVAAAVLLLSLSSAAIAEGPAELDEARFEELIKELAPDASTPWRTIPWKTSLLAAQREAAAEKKPIFIWAMDGHPLGCT